MAEPSLRMPEAFRLLRPPGGVDDLVRRRESFLEDVSAGIDAAEAKLTAEAAEGSLRIAHLDERDREEELGMMSEWNEGWRRV